LIKVAAPSYSMTAHKGELRFVQTALTQKIIGVMAGNGDPSYGPYGMTIDVQAATPADLPGELCSVQLVKGYMELNGWRGLDAPGWVLDSRWPQFPAPNQYWPAVPGAIYKINDSPGIWDANTDPWWPFKCSIELQFKTHLMFKSGFGDWTPLALVNWSVVSETQAPPWPESGIPPGAITPGAKIDNREHPFWDDMAYAIGTAPGGGPSGPSGLGGAGGLGALQAQSSVNRLAVLSKGNHLGLEDRQALVETLGGTRK